MKLSNFSAEMAKIEKKAVEFPIICPLVAREFT